MADGMKKKEIIGIILRCALALTLFLIAVLNYDSLSTLDVAKLVSFTSSIPLICAVVLAVYVVKAVVFVVPASLIYVAVGAILNEHPLLAVGINLLGIFLEISVTWLLGKFLGKDAVYKLLSKKEAGRKILERNLGDKAGVLFAIRAIPAFPIDWLSLFYGASGCKYPKYAAVSVAGLSWRVILFTILGDAAFSWIPMDKLIFIGICCIPVGVIYYLIKKFVLDPKKQKAATAANAATEEAEEKSDESAEK